MQYDIILHFVPVFKPVFFYLCKFPWEPHRYKEGYRERKVLVRMKQYNVGVIGATGMVGQRFITRWKITPGLIWLPLRPAHAALAKPMRRPSAAAG